MFPQEVIALIVSNLLQPIKAIDWDIPRKQYHAEYMRHKTEAISQAEIFINVSLVSKDWSRVIHPATWRTLQLLLIPDYYNGSDRGARFNQTHVYCCVRDSQLTHAIKKYIKQEKLVYRSPKIKRRNDTDNLGMKKLLKLGRDKLWGPKKQHFIEMSKEWKLVHQNQLKLQDILRKNGGGML
jgi:hypothetical protein